MCSDHKQKDDVDLVIIRFFLWMSQKCCKKNSHKKPTCDGEVMKYSGEQNQDMEYLQAPCITFQFSHADLTQTSQ